MRNIHKNSVGADTPKTCSNSALCKGRTSIVREDFPIEVMMLLDVLSRIESRRQAKLLITEKEVC